MEGSHTLSLIAEVISEDNACTRAPLSGGQWLHFENVKGVERRHLLGKLLHVKEQPKQDDPPSNESKRGGLEKSTQLA